MMAKPSAPPTLMWDMTRLQLCTKLEEFSDKLDEQEAVIEKYAKENKELKDDYKAVMGKLKDISADLLRSQKRADQLSDERNRLRNDVNCLAGRISDTIQDHLNTQGRLARVSNELMESHQCNRQFRNILHERIRELEAQNAALVQEIELLRERP